MSAKSSINVNGTFWPHPRCDAATLQELVKKYHLNPSKFYMPEVTQNRAKFTTLAVDTYKNVISDHIRGIERKSIRKRTPLDYDDIFPLYKHWDMPNKWGLVLPNATEDYDVKQQSPLFLPQISESAASQAAEVVSDRIPEAFEEPEFELPPLKKSHSMYTVYSEKK